VESMKIINAFFQTVKNGLEERFIFFVIQSIKITLMFWRKGDTVTLELLAL